MRRLLGSALIVAALVAALGCTSGPAPPPPRRLEPVFHEPRLAPGSDVPKLLLDTVSGLVFASYDKDAEHVWVSMDEGASWTERATLPRAPRMFAAHEGCPDLHRLEVLPGGLFQIQGLAADARRSRITEAEATYASLVFAPDDRAGAVWIDRGRGWPELMFSQSLDHGASWSPPVRVNTESRGKEIATPALLSHRGGWVVVWTENRDPQTLFDLYGSFSRDGERWEPSRRMNDDAEPAFSVSPSAVADERAVHVVAQDYRELNRFHDRDANIYYARLTTGGGASVPNVRVNDVTDAPQSWPSLTLDKKSDSLVAVWLDARHRLTGDIYASISTDAGASWSLNRRVNVNTRPEVMSRPSIVPRRAEGGFIMWQQTLGLSTRTWIRPMTLGEPSGGPQETQWAPAKPAGPLIEPIPDRHLLVHEQFDGKTLGGLRPLAGSWVVRQGSLLGFGYGPAFAEWTGPPIDDFMLEGRFRLDSSSHLAAHLLLRVRPVPGEPGAFEGYHLRNHFRMGVLLSRSRFLVGGDRTPLLFAADPLVDRWLPLRQDTWYAFRVVVQGGRLDYWLDGAWVLSADGLDPHPGGIVFGTDSLGPVEWDDLSLYSFDTSQHARSR